MRFAFDNTYARELPGFHMAWQPATVPAPRLLFLNHGLAAALGLDLADCRSAELAELFSGNRLPAGAEPIAQVYAGHQFGHFSPQLGDGRALLIGELIDCSGVRRDIAFKGSGRTPYSRGGDGKAAIGPMLREVLIGEAMHALGIPTSRALAVVASGELIQRERALPGAVLTRVAASHIRIGSFEYFAARGDTEGVRRLAEYAIARHDPQLCGLPAAKRHLEFLRAVCERQAALIARWMCVGFIHGVMNTDNMSIAGETIDYGPCAFMETYDPDLAFSSIDQHGRYAYGRQPAIAQWNLARFAEALLPLLADEERQAHTLATAVIAEFPTRYHAHWLAGMRAKLGLTADTRPQDADADADTDRALAEDWLQLLHACRIDFTLAWHHLADALEGRDEPLQHLFATQAGDGMEKMASLAAWLQRWRLRRGNENSENRAAARATMRRANPLVIPRNQHVETALTAAERDDLIPFRQLLSALETPCVDSLDADPALTHFATPSSAGFMARYRTYCGT
ncbi:conserved protein of unknown function [Sterolibacterium denitrificans]|uniref:Protein nucleotidyltransferase YdiU n=2 Tax=Sterolibacterium denitrificans TaxID=157592 RepID=A0A656Z7C3_9PROT|nr:YdiU family protein [Sterolibacterium denitrificans]KYC28922.1 hypothetical protein ACY05_03445 [Sterolibacterium denitrificans]SMB23344.1 conserved protein of unknown function [Sterolibacterium denitrificans]